MCFPSPTFVRSARDVAAKVPEHHKGGSTYKGREGYRWPEWQSWLAEHSSDRVSPPPIGAPDHGYPVLADAPGTYVLQE